MEHARTPNSDLPPIPAKRYFTIGEVSELCGVKAHVSALLGAGIHPAQTGQARGNRRYYQHHEVLLIRRIRQLLYEEGFTISGARSRLDQTLIKQEETKTVPVVAKPVFNVHELRRDIHEVLLMLQA